MGSKFDFFSTISWPSDKTIASQARANRLLLQNLMVSEGFVPLKEAWWHFTLVDEPFPNTYFDFDIE